jgi:acyl-coenzyme A synthetase/AMP-(fatty) acid ligase
MVDDAGGDRTVSFAASDATAQRMVDDAGGDRTVSFAAMAQRAAQVGSFLATHGIGSGDRILVM